MKEDGLDVWQHYLFVAVFVPPSAQKLFSYCRELRFEKEDEFEEDEQKKNRHKAGTRQISY